MTKESIWKLKSSPNHFTQLMNEISADVAIIGGGITGITTAQLLMDSGLKVVVLESRKVGMGTTGHSTGNLYEVTEYELKELKKKYDIDTLNQIIYSRREAMSFIVENVNNFQIDCDFQTVDMHIYESGGDTDIREERKIANEMDLSFEESGKMLNIPFNSEIVYKGQAQINPLAYVQHLAKEVSAQGCEIYEDTRVIEIEEHEDNDLITLQTNKTTVTARYVVHATHTPIGLQLQYHPVLGPYREYGVAVKLKTGEYPTGIFWGDYENGKYSIRCYHYQKDSYLICVGSMHKTGQTEDNQAHIENVANFLKTHFDVDQVAFEWGGQNYKPADLLPYIGAKEKGSKQFVATGFSTDGLVYGTVAARIIADAIMSRNNPYSELFKASRHQPVKAAGKFMKENINMAGQMIKDYLSSDEKLHEPDLGIGEGRIVTHNNNKLAVYKKPNGELKILSPICPHMGCTVHWNNAEKSWDCPCHGSRFDTEGKVIEGPALTGLKDEH